MTTPIYAFTGEQLEKLLDGTVEMFVEYRDQHGRDEPAAKNCAVLEMLQGLGADLDLCKVEKSNSVLQLTPSQLAARFSNPSLDQALNSGDGSHRP